MKKWYVEKSSIDGQGAFASWAIREGEAIDIGINYYLLIPFVTEFGSMINHSRNPNTSVRYDEDDGVYYIRANRYIPSGTEITVDYRKTPNFIEGPEDWFV